MGMLTLDEGLKARPRTWLVTGAAGFIGSSLLEALLELDQQVVGLDNFSLGRRANLDEVQAAVGARRWRNLRFIEGDIRSLDTCRRACREVEVVLHHAALGSVPASLADPVACHESNVSGFLNMLVAARNAGVARFVYASSSATYGDNATLPQAEEAIGSPLSPYGLSKRVDEMYADVYARCYGFASIGLRYFNVFGPRQDPEGAYAAVIPKWIAEMIRGEPVVIHGDGETSRDFCYVANVVEANLRAATVADPAALNQVYNVALGEKTTLNRLFELLRGLLAPRFPRLRGLRAQHGAVRSGDVRFSVADIDRARRLLGYQPAWTVGAGLAHAIDWYVEKLEAAALAT
jgi:UDP-N-acetylglucosamine/UDP-N-acetyl-alpha-D-glucosaminouronate 4-epimerase